jgi:hypothetical protein
VDSHDLREYAKWPAVRHPALQRILDRWPEPRLSSWTEPHWACGSCGQPCMCELPDFPHTDCGLVDNDWRGSA